ncbi:type II toxin-antitoxin system RelE/ParE family toxin [Parabacteroides goldsteinii]|uniref:type II toxin-antitoxin system RelE/ParE family toxin n=1 Tax=Parabacteroides goldsteinii TaxID=328812 RepID=UPI00101D934B|nr:type II toxin-antitoxin system RelE/ParE family toxin [Parabacteroides goldsteinii]
MEIIWTPLSLKSLSELLHFVRKAWGEKKSFEIRKLIEHNVLLLEKHPHLGRVLPETESKSVKIRSLIIKRKNRVFYRVEGEKIYIILVWDVRKDPEILFDTLNAFID